MILRRFLPIYFICKSTAYPLYFTLNGKGGIQMKLKFLFGSAIIVIIIAIFGVWEFINLKQVSDGDKSINNQVVEVVGEAPEPKVYDAKLGEWASKMHVMLSEPMDDPQLKQTNNDEGFEYYLKAQAVMREFPYQLIKEDKEVEKEHSNLFLLESYISHMQFVRTVHLGPNGEAREAVELVDQWAPTDDYMRQAFEYMKQIVNDIDVAVNHNGEGKIYGVTHLLNGEKVFEVEKFISGTP